PWWPTAPRASSAGTRPAWLPAATALRTCSRNWSRASLIIRWLFANCSTQRIPVCPQLTIEGEAADEADDARTFRRRPEKHEMVLEAGPHRRHRPVRPLHVLAVPRLDRPGPLLHELRR